MIAGDRLRPVREFESESTSPQFPPGAPTIVLERNLFQLLECELGREFPAAVKVIVAMIHPDQLCIVCHLFAEVGFNIVQMRNDMIQQTGEPDAVTRYLICVDLIPCYAYSCEIVSEQALLGVQSLKTVSIEGDDSN